MLRKPITLLLAAIILVLLAYAGANAAPGVVKEDLKEIIPLSQVRPGMKGYGLTVFRGTRIERFDVEIIGILRKVNNGKDWIMVRMAGGPITQRGANIIQGMSGSPVYVNGKIIGAVAYGPGSFSKEPLGMLTPIEDMLDALDPNLPARPSGLSSGAASSLSSPIKVGDQTIRRIEIGDRTSSSAAPDGTLVMTPLMTPVMVSGMSARGIAKLTDLLDPYGMIPMAGPGAKADSVPVEFKPGAAVGVSLATGDIDLTGIGTLTYRRGNKIVAFGHPMFNIGPVDAPMTTAFVHDVFPSYQISSKIASPIKTIGRISQDRPWSIGGEVGKMPQMIPVTVDIDNAAIGRKRTAHVGIINHPILTPRLLLIVSAEALTETHGIPGDAMAKVKLEIEADQVGKIVRENQFFDQASIEIGALGDMQAILNILANNRFHPVDVKSVRLSVKIESGRRTAAVERIYVDKGSYEPGETIKVGVELRPYKSELIVKTMSVVVPQDAPDGRMPLLVVGGGMAGGPPMMGPDGGAKGPQMIVSAAGTAENVRQIIDEYLEQEKNNDLVARLVLPSAAVSVAGEKLSGLPGPIANVMKSPRTSVVKLEREEVKVVEPTDYVLMGGQTLAVKIERRRLSEKKQRSQPSQSPATQIESSPPPIIEMEESPSDEGMDFSMALPVALAAPPSTALEKTQSMPATAETASATTEAKDSASNEKSETKSDAASGKTAEKSVVRQPETWVQKSFQDFAKGTFKGTAATTEDDVRLARSISKLADISENYVWSVLPDGSGGVYAATGDHGIIFRIGSDGTSSEFFKTGEFEVHSIVKDSLGNIYASTAPNGRVYKMTPDGKGEMILDASEKYALALAVDSKDNVYVAYGDGGKIYRLAPSGTDEVFVTVPEASVLSLAIDGADNLYAGTGLNGIIYKITPDKTMSAVYNAAEDAISSVAVDAAGNVYAGAGDGKGNIYKIPASGVPDVVYDKAPRVLSLAVDKANNVYAVSDEQIIKIMPDKTVMSLDINRAGAQFVSVAVADDGSIYAGAANMGVVYRSAMAAEGVYESPVHDAGLPSKWGKISWLGDTREGAEITLETRTGNVAEPDATWSSWTPVSAGKSAQAVLSPAGRFIQYRANLAGSKDGEPVLKQISVAYLTENRAPKVVVTDPQPGAVIARKETIKWKATDPDKDALIYDLYYSADSGKTWNTIGSGFRQSKNGNGTEDLKKESGEEPAEEQEEKDANVDASSAAPPDADELMSQLKSELDQHPEIPQEIKDKMIAEAPAAIDKAVDAAADQSGKSDVIEDSSESGEGGATKQTSYSWDTTKVADGSYMIKVVASDRISNAVGFLSDEKVIGPVTVANEPPRVSVFRKEIKVNQDRTVIFDGYAYNMRIPLVGVQYKVGTGEWMAAAAKDGIFDSGSEPFTVSTQPLSKGKHTIEVKVVDAAGNAVTDKVVANVP